MRRRAWNWGVAAGLVVFIRTAGALAQAPPTLPPLGGPPPANAPGAKPLPPLPEAPPPPAPAPPPVGPVQDVTILPPLPPPAAEPSPASVPLAAPVGPVAPGMVLVPMAAPEPPLSIRQHGFSFGLRFDLAYPFGNINSVASIDANEASGAGFASYLGVLFSFGADVGYRLTPHWYVGGYFAAGPATNPIGSQTNCTGSLQCSLNDLRFGLDAKYLGSPQANTDPWIGAGIGWEIANISTDAAAFASYGPEFLHLRAGLDFRLSQHIYVGPEAMFAMGVFTNGLGKNAASGADISAALHEWLSIGVGGHWDQ